MKNIIFLIIFISTSVFAVPQTINNYLKENPTWFTDTPSHNFLSTRCLVLNTIAYERLKIQGGEEAKNLAAGYDESRKYFYEFSLLSKQMAQISDEAYEERMMVWAKIYGDEAISNWNTYNSLWEGDLGDDLMTCNKVLLPKFSEYAEALEKAMKELAL